MSQSTIDEAFLSVSAFVEEAAALEGIMADPSTGIAMSVQTATVSMPLEMDIVVGEDGTVALGAIPPLYYVDTTVQPVFHQITLTLEADEAHEQ